MNSKKKSKTKFICLLLLPIVLLIILSVVCFGIVSSDLGSNSSLRILEFMQNIPVGFLVLYPVYSIVVIILHNKKMKKEPYDQQDIDTLLKDKPDKKEKYGGNIGIFLSLSVISWLVSLVLALIIEAIFSLDGRWSFREEAITATIISLIPISLLFKGLRENNNNEQVQKKIDFYKECLKQNISQVESHVEVEKAKLIAKKMGFNNVSDIVAFYAECEKLHNGGHQTNDSLANAKRQERKKFEEYTKYAEFTAGREKRLNMLADELKEAIKEKDKAYMQLSSARNFGKEKEKDWGWRAGMASALGGTAAAVATVVDVATENAQIREKNEQPNAIRTLLESEANTELASAIHKVERLQKRLDDAQIKLVYEADGREILKQIQFSNTQITVSDTGAIEIEATAKLNHSLKIFDGLAAVVDGTVIAEIYDNNVRVGEAKLVLPSLGLTHSTAISMKGICLRGGKKEKKNQYTVSFKPYHLWEMEA